MPRCRAPSAKPIRTWRFIEESLALVSSSSDAEIEAFVYVHIYVYVTLDPPQLLGMFCTHPHKHRSQVWINQKERGIRDVWALIVSLTLV